MHQSPRTRAHQAYRPSWAHTLLAVGSVTAIGVSLPAQDSHTRLTPADTAGRRIVLITGSTDGLGREVALNLASTGAHIIVHGRNVERGAEVVQEIKAGGKGSARFFRADLASLAEVRQFAQAILRDYTRLNVLINNAGIWGQGNERKLSADGHELHFAVNYLSHFLLTRTLLPLIEKSASAAAPSRIISVASAAQTPIDFNDVMLANRYSDGRGYGQSKLAQILFTMDLAKELEGKNVIAASLHPATMMNTTMVLSRGAQTRATVEEGAAAVTNVVTSPDVKSGDYFRGQTAARANEQAYDEAAREQLRTLSMRLTGLSRQHP